MLYPHTLVTAEEALRVLKKGSRILIGSGCGEPQHLVRTLVANAEKFYDVEIIQVLSTGVHLYSDDHLTEHFQVKNFFVAGSGAREAIWEGRADYIPMFMSRVPRLFTDRIIELDAVLIQVSPPNEHGYVSLGIAVDACKEAIAAAETVIDDKIQVEKQKIIKSIQEEVKSQKQRFEGALLSVRSLGRARERIKLSAPPWRGKLTAYGLELSLLPQPKPHKPFNLYLLSNLSRNFSQSVTHGSRVVLNKRLI